MNNSPDNDEPIASTVTVFSETNKISTSLLRWTEAPESIDAVKLSIKVGETEYSALSEDGFFYALQSMRQKIAAQDLRIACMGCCENVYPSPMITSMGDGEKAYQLTMNQPALLRDLVNIFDPCAEDLVVSVAEQEDFYKRWLNSLG